MSVLSIRLTCASFRLTAELALAKERSRQTAGALACDSGLENLRRLSTELEARRKQFYQETSDKDIELKFREKALKEKEVWKLTWKFLRSDHSGVYAF